MVTEIKDIQARKKQILEKIRELKSYPKCFISSKCVMQELIKEFDTLPKGCGETYYLKGKIICGQKMLLEEDYIFWLCPSCQAQQEEIKHFKEMFR